jgi:hypothetical protein
MNISSCFKEDNYIDYRCEVRRKVGELRRNAVETITSSRLPIILISQMSHPFGFLNHLSGAGENHGTEPREEVGGIQRVHPGA